MRVKFCGMTSLEDAREAARLGAWAIGLIHHRESPRYCEPGVAAEIGARLRRRLEVHGDEGPAFCQEAARRTGCGVIKALRVRSAADVQAAEAYRTALHLLDAYRPGTPGGTGESFDWELLAGRRSQVPLILAGGLTPDNLGRAVSVARPFAVDVASGVEAEPGVKDHSLMAKFAEQAQRASSDPRVIA